MRVYLNIFHKGELVKTTISDVVLIKDVSHVIFTIPRLASRQFQWNMTETSNKSFLSRLFSTV